MVAQKTKTKLTYDDYAKTPEDERWELINGELIKVATPSVAHQMALSEIIFPLATFVKAGDLGSVFPRPTDVVLSDYDTVQPDVVFVSKERESVITRANIQGAPDLVVEILSPSTARWDWRDKFDLYELHGAPEYWLADPGFRTIWVFVLREGAFAEAGRYGEGDTLVSPTLAGFELDLSDVFRVEFGDRKENAHDAS